MNNKIAIATRSVVAIIVFSASTLLAAGSTGRQALTTSVLRVCADPGNLPFSNDKLEGFENRIISLLGEHMGLEVRYTWFPQTIGFVRNTLRLRECDLISGITTTSERVQNTNPYYRSVYSMVYRTDSGITATRVADPQLRELTLGVVAGTPPATVIATLGLLDHVKPYHLVADTRRYQPAQRAVEDVGAGVTDVAFIWGPIAAYFARRSTEELTLVPLIHEDKSVRLDFRVSMAVRYNETDWKREINAALKELQPKIDEILREYDVPLLSDRGLLITK